MAYTGREKLLDKSCNSIYKLVILSAKRALEIAEGQTITLPKVLVGCSLGPDDADKVRLVIGKLPLLR